MKTGKISTGIRNSVSTPIEGGLLPPRTEAGKGVETEKYQSKLGGNQYLTIWTRPDLAFAQSELAQYATAPRTEHHTALQRTQRYLKGTIDFGLLFGKPQNNEGIIPIGYADADFARSRDRKSITGYAFMINGGVVSYASRKQTSVAISTTEAEYIAVATAAREAIWLQRLMKTTTLPTWNDPINIKGDNAGAYYLAINEARNLNERTKHIDIKWHFIREKIEQKEISMEQVGTNENVADIFTKPLARPKFERLRTALGVVSLSK